MTRKQLLKKVMEFQGDSNIEQLISANDVLKELILSEETTYIEDVAFDLQRHVNRIKSAIDFIRDNYNVLEKFE